MLSNNNNINNVTIRPPRRCGHCKVFGHNIITCDSINRYLEVLYHSALEKVHADVLQDKNGSLFEKWVNDLTQTDLKYLVWKITNTHNTYDLVHSNNIIFEYFADLNIGYDTYKTRRIRNYLKVYHAVHLDMIYETKGIETDHCLKNVMSETEVDDVYFKIITDYSSNRDETFQREFDNWYIQPGLMPHKHFIIHCHFAELGIGYSFQIQNIPGYIQRSSQRETQRLIRENNTHNQNPDVLVEEVVQEEEDAAILFVEEEEYWSDDDEEEDHNNPNVEMEVDFQQNILTLKYTKNGPYPIQSQIDYQINKIKCKNNKNTDELHDNCCAVCMETKQKKEYLVTDCNHFFCNLCTGKIMVNAISKYKTFDCPLCRKNVSSFNYYNENAIHTMFL
jgi:hypothetical protein